MSLTTIQRSFSAGQTFSQNADKTRLIEVEFEKQVGSQIVPLTKPSSSPYYIDNETFAMRVKEKHTLQNIVDTLNKVPVVKDFVKGCNLDGVVGYSVRYPHSIDARVYSTTIPPTLTRVPIRFFLDDAKITSHNDCVFKLQFMKFYHESITLTFYQRGYSYQELEAPFAFHFVPEAEVEDQPKVAVQNTQSVSASQPMPAAAAAAPAAKSTPAVPLISSKDFSAEKPFLLRRTVSSPLAPSFQALSSPRKAG